MKPVSEQIHAVRALVRVDDEVRASIERAMEAETKRPASASRVGDVFGCADERGLNVLVAPRADGAELTVNDLAPAVRGLPIVALFMALGALAMVGLSVATSSPGVLVAAVVLVLMAAGFQLGAALDRRRRRKRVERLADTIAEATSVRARVEVEREEHEIESVAHRPSHRRGATRRD